MQQSMWWSYVASPAITTAVLLGLGYIFRDVILSWLQKRIAHDYDVQLERLRADFRRDEQNLAAQLRRQDIELEALRSGALSSLTARTMKLQDLRIEAAGRLWNEIALSSKTKGLAMIVSQMNIEKMLKAASNNDHEGQRIRKIAEHFWESFDLENELKRSQAPDADRLFIAPTAWSLFSAYRLMLRLPALQIAAVRAGLSEEAFNPAAVVSMIKEAMPDRAAFLDKVGIKGIALLIGEMEEMIFAALVKDFDGSDEQKKAVEKARAVMTISSELLSGQERLKALGEIPKEFRVEPPKVG